MTFLKWLVGLICPATATQKAVARKNKEIILRFELERKKTFGISLQLLSRWDQLVVSMSTKSDSTSLHMDWKGYSILEVMIELHCIPGVTIEDNFHDFASEYLSLRMKREMWASMGNLEKKIKMVMEMYTRSKHP
jgi:hypothetical protein